MTRYETWLLQEIWLELFKQIGLILMIFGVVVITLFLVLYLFEGISERRLVRENQKAQLAMRSAPAEWTKPTPITYFSSISLGEFRIIADEGTFLLMDRELNDTTDPPATARNLRQIQ